MAKLNQLSDTAIRKAKPTSKIQKLNDGDGLRLEITKAGTKVFKYRFKLAGKDSDYVIGEYPNTKLADARKLRDDVKALVKSGINPNDYKKQQQAKQREEMERQLAQQKRMTFSDLFELWHEHNATDWTYDYAKDIRERVENHLLPEVGNHPLEDIKPTHMRVALKQIEAKGLMETLKRSKQYASRIFRYGVGMGYCESDPVRDLPSDIFKKQDKTNFNHLTDRKDLFQLLNAIDSYVGDVSIRTALQLAPHLFLRPNELAGLRWDEVNLENSLIVIQAERMKKKREHLVPLSKQAKGLIESMLVFKDGNEFVFPSPMRKARHINGQSLNVGLHSLGFKGMQTTHGFRHTASTLLNENGFNGDYVEKQLAHEEANKVRGTYNKAQYLPQRTEMMQAWSDYLDGIKQGADVVPFKSSTAR